MSNTGRGHLLPVAELFCKKYILGGAILIYEIEASIIAVSFSTNLFFLIHHEKRT